MVAVLGTLFLASPAGADTFDILEIQQPAPSALDGFQAAPCTVDFPFCSASTPGQFFRTAGGHPAADFFHFIVKHQVFERDLVEPVREPLAGRTPSSLRVDLPPGLTINPGATAEECTLTAFSAFECKPGARVGEVQLNLVSTLSGFSGLPKGGFFQKGEPNISRVDLFNLVPRFGEPALFGFFSAVGNVLLHPEVAWESDFHQSVTISGIPDFSGLPITIHSARTILQGNSGDGTTVTLPTTCFNPDAAPQFNRLYSSWIRMDSREAPDPSFPFGSTPIEASLPAGARPEGCENIPFDPSIEVDPGTTEVDAATSPTVTTRLRVEVPGTGGGPIAGSHLRTAEVALPRGLGLNPAGSVGLVSCPDPQFHKGDRELTSECPDRSIIGSAELVTPLLSEPLQGNVYLGEQRSRDPASGDQFRVFVEAGSFARGVIVRLIGRVRADPRTGQLTAVFDDQRAGQFAGPLPHGLPQVPFQSLRLRFDGRPQVVSSRPLFTTPPTCAPATTTTRMEPWARPGTFEAPLSTFTLSSFPGGGGCPRSLGERPFSPPYTARPDSSRAGSFSPFRVRLVRPEGQQELKQLSLTLPKGLIGRLAGIPYCPGAALATAAGKSGAAEQSSPSCPAASSVGTTITEAGSGNDPLRLGGRVYLAGPYKGAPISMAVITPALSGPFDLGNVVIRVALPVDRESAQISAVSDPIPDVFGGVKLNLRAIELNLDRNQFMLNPTRCAAEAITGTIAGGGADPTDPGAWRSLALNVPFRASGCEGLDFKPQLVTTISGPVKRGRYPSLSAALHPRPGDANIARVAVALPRSFFVAQEHFTTLCTRPQLAADNCPASSAYGQAEARTPLLDGRLSGPVYLVPGGGQLPDLVADLRGQVDIRLRGKISSAKKGGIEAVFDSIPDVPVSEFALRMAGGKRGLLVNSANVCKARRPATLDLRSQNGKQVLNRKYKLKITGCKKHRKKQGKQKRQPKG